MNARALLAALCGLALACGVSQQTVDALQRDVQREKADLQAAKGSAQPLDAYARGLASGTFPAPMSFVYLSPNDLMRAMTEYFPYRIPARDLLGDASGEIDVRAVSQPQLQSRNRMRMRLSFDGRNVQVRNVPSLYAGEVRKAMDGLQAGVDADLEATLVYYPQTRAASVRAVCVDVNLRRNNDPSYRAEIKRYINDRMLDRPVQIGIPPLNGMPAEAVFLTGDHVVLQYRQ